MVVPLVNWHVGSLPADIVIAVGVPTGGPMTTVLVTIKDGPLQPLAVTWISTVPENPLAQVITPVEAPMLPAEGLLRLQLKPVLLVAVVVYVVVVVPLVSWQVGSLPAETVIAVGVPTVGVTWIVPVAFILPQPPVNGML